MAPNINSATARVLDAMGVQTVLASGAGCCGAVKYHLNDQDGGLAEMRTNIDAWWAHIEPAGGRVAPVEAIIMNASGCGVTVKEYGHILQNDPNYATKAARVSELTVDISEWLPQMVRAFKARLAKPGRSAAGKIAFHPPCSLQHGQKLRDGVETHLGELGFEVKVTGCESHLCCGSAGTFSVLNPKLSYQLRDRKLGNLGQTFGSQAPDQIVSANIGCITHLQSGTATPVRHWIEVLDEALSGSPAL